MYPYQQQFPLYQQQPNILPQQQILQTNGKPTFEAYKLAPNSSVLLADTTAPIVWKCVSDGLGNVSAEAFDITPHKDEATIDQAAVTPILAEMNSRITRLEELINDKSITTRKSTKRTNGDAEDV